MVGAVVGAIVNTRYQHRHICLGTTGASTSTDVDKNTTLGVTIMCEKHFALSAKYIEVIEVIFFTIPIGFCPIFP